MTTEQENPNPGTTPDETPGTALPPDAQPSESDAPDQPPEEGDEAEAGEAGELPAEAPAEGSPDAPSAVGAVGEKELERMFKRVETANVAYSKKIGDILGDEATVLEPCPRCGDPFIGFTWPPAMKPVADDRKRAVLASVGESMDGATEHTKYARRCDECDGWGVVLTGSRTNRDRTIGCPTCKSRGWIAVGDELRVGRSDLPAGAPANGAAGDVIPSAELPEQPPDLDPWGRPPSDPDYGRLPNFATRA